MLPARSLPRFFLLCAIGFALSAPFLWMVCASFKSRVEVEQAHIVPHEPAMLNYPVVLDLLPDPVTDVYLGVRFGRWYFNSIFVATGITLFQVLTSAMAAYAFSRIEWPGRDQVFLLYLGTMMIPGVVTMIPNFQLMVSFGFVNTYHGLIIPAAFSAFGTFLLRQFMLSIPPSLDEAATIDGAGHWRIFWDIIIPLSRSGLIALCILTFLGAYQSFFWPLVMLQDDQLFTMPVGMLRLDSSYGRQTELIMAATVMNIVPLIVVFVMFQKFLVKGLQLGGVKG
jgi:ABC-type glycerol-3-phosphate transport system permease component